MQAATTFAGNLTGDPALRFTPSGTAVADLRVAVNRRTRNKAGEWEDAPATFHNVKVWGRAAENVAESVQRGHRVTVHGQVETDTWEKDGQTHSRDYVVVSERYGDIGISLKFAPAQPVTVQRTKSQVDEHAGQDEDPPF